MTRPTFRRAGVRLAAISCSALFTVLAAPLSATVYVPADLATVVQEAGVIVHGRVVDVRSVLSRPQGAIQSLVTVSVMESVKGSAGTVVTFRVPGGQLGRYRRIVVGSPQFAGGDELVVFLRGRAPAVPTLVGLSQGVYRVTRDAAGTLVLPVPVKAGGTGDERIVRGDPARQPVTVDAFLREVHALVEQGR